MVIGEVLTGIALVKQATDFIKQNIDTCRDISDIAGSIDDLFKGEKEAQKARSKKSKFGLSDQFGVESVAQEIIDAKLAAEKLQEIGTLIDLRFGPGTFAGIKAERAKRIEEARKIEQEEKRQRAMERKQLKQDIALGFSVFLAIVVVLGIVVLMIMFS